MIRQIVIILLLSAAGCLAQQCPQGFTLSGGQCVAPSGSGGSVTGTAPIVVTGGAASCPTCVTFGTGSTPLIAIPGSTLGTLTIEAAPTGANNTMVGPVIAPANGDLMYAVLVSAGVWQWVDSGIPYTAVNTFAALTSGTNTTAALILGTGASLGVSGSATIAATTAAALAVTPTPCSTGSAPTGVLANGNSTGCATIATAPPGVIRPVGSDCLCALHADPSVWVSGAASVVVVTGTDTSIPASGTWTSTGGGCTTQPSGTLTGSAGNLATVTITNQGAGCTGNPTLIPSSGSIGTSTITFSSCANATVDGSTQTAFLTTWTQAANFWSTSSSLDVTEGFSYKSSSGGPSLSIYQYDNSTFMWEPTGISLGSVAVLNHGFGIRFSLVGGPATNQLTLLPISYPVYVFSSFQTGELVSAITYSASYALGPQAKWSNNTAGNVACFVSMGFK